MGQRVKLVAKNGKEAEVVLAVLSDKHDQTRLDLYINCTQNVVLSVQAGGAKHSEIHLSGYFEPKGEEMDDDMFYGAEEDEEDEDEEALAKGAKSKDGIDASLQQAKLNS